MIAPTNTKPKPFCFVLMPFDSSFNDIYEFGIKGACSDAGLYCERVDEQVFLGSMLERIYSQISRADILVADMTGRNANVFYEVGYAHALGKNVVLLTSVAQDIPFDLKHFPHIVYGNEIKTLKAGLVRTLKHLTDVELSRNDTRLGIELYVGNTRLAGGKVEVVHTENSPRLTKVTVLNQSMVTYQAGAFRVAVIAPSNFPESFDDYVFVSALPDGTYMHMLPKFDTLFPGAATTFEFYLHAQENMQASEFMVNLRVFSSAGVRDFPLCFRRVT